MKVLSRSRWPLPPKVRTGEGGSNDPTIHRHVAAMWMFCESECVRCEVSRGSSWPPREGRARLRGAKPATKQPPCLMGPAQTDRWPATKDHSLHHSDLCLVAGLVATSGGSRLKTEEIWLHSKPLTKAGPSLRSCVNLLQCWLKLSSSRPWPWP